MFMLRKKVQVFFRRLGSIPDGMSNKTHTTDSNLINKILPWVAINDEGGPDNLVLFRELSVHEKLKGRSFFFNFKQFDL